MILIKMFAKLLLIEFYYKKILFIIKKYYGKLVLRKKIYSDKELHIYARKCVELYKNIDKKQLKYNDIVICAQKFYYTDAKKGIEKLIESCDKNSFFYVKGNPMAESLMKKYQFLID